MTNETQKKIANEMMISLSENLLSKWYPLVIDNESGGYLTNLTNDMKLMPEQEKMIVTQARHVWTLSKAAKFFDDGNYFKMAEHGLDFIKDKFWDSNFGGYFQIRNKEGGLCNKENWGTEKRTYGNAFAIYGLSALFHLTKNSDAIAQAKKSFQWIEDHAYDPEYQGYFQFLTLDGTPFDKNSEYKTYATDAIECGYKDQNSSIHMLEAYTELYNIWKDEKLKTQLTGLLKLIRDTITHPKGYLQLFFERDWTPVSFRNAPKEIREQNYRLDHVSFGHDYETAFLMLEASHSLGIENDKDTLEAAKKMIDHAIENGWDDDKGGFFDEGYYLADNEECTIIKDTKTWWQQAEALNALLLFSKIFPNQEKYAELFRKEWEYVKEYLIDHENGDWYWGSLEKEPFYKSEPKGSIWKGTYHTGRSLMNCINMLSENEESILFIEHWKKTAEN
ncbi:MAG: AGE family epimerase/isomerase [Melioribacteraceae bacterium]|nr:AGE family epimerase/isomerase [Melioribacteraceae bacterium]